MCLQSQHCLSEQNLSLFVPAVSGVGHLLSAPQHGLIKNKDLSTKNRVWLPLHGQKGILW